MKDVSSPLLMLKKNVESKATGDGMVVTSIFCAVYGNQAPWKLRLAEHATKDLLLWTIQVYCVGVASSSYSHRMLL